MPNITSSGLVLNPRLINEIDPCNSVQTPSFNDLVPKLTSKDLVTNPNLIAQIDPGNTMRTIEDQPIVNHGVEKAFLCILCFQSFQHKLELTLHNKTVHNGIIFDCVICGKPHMNKNDLSKHILEVHEGNQPTFIKHDKACYICNEKCLNFGALKNHIESVHEGKKELLQPTFDTSDFNVLNESTETKLNDGEIFHYENIIESNTENHEELILQNKTVHNIVASDNAICGKPHMGKQDLSKHVSEIHKEYQSSFQLHCYICKEKYDIFGDLKNHLESHNGNGFDCAICGKPHMNKNDLSKHVWEIHEGYESSFKLYCYICNENYYVLSDLKNHIELAHEGKKAVHEGVIFDCAICGKPFKSQQNVSKHISGIHDEGKNPLSSHFQKRVCYICSARYRFFGPLKAHIKSAHEGKNPLKNGYIFDCVICGKPHLDQLDLLKHVSEIHKGKDIEEVHEERKSHQCTLCNKTFTAENLLHLHIESFHQNKPFSISNNMITPMEAPIEKEDPRKCLNLSSNNQIINSVVHEEKEQNTQNTKCIQCSADFTDESNLNAHIAMVHDRRNPFSEKIEFTKGVNTEANKSTSNQENTLKWPFKCEFCITGFNHERDLLNHTKDHDERNTMKKDSNIEEIPPTFKTRKKFKCKICNSQFVELRNVDFHMARIHGEVDPTILKCNFCYKFYTRDSCDLKEHMKVHEEKKNLDEQSKTVYLVEKPFSCLVCKATFTCKANLRIHYNISHEGMKQSNDPCKTVHEVEKPLSCSICNAAFKSEKILRIHKQVHLGVQKLLDEPKIQSISNISQNNSQLLEKAVATIQEEEIVAGQPHDFIDLSNEETTFPNEQVNFQTDNYLDYQTGQSLPNYSQNNSHLWEKREKPVTSVSVEEISTGQAHDFIDLSIEGHTLSHEQYNLEIEKAPDDPKIQSISNSAQLTTLGKSAMTIYEEKNLTGQAHSFINLSNEEDTFSQEQVDLRIEKPPYYPNMQRMSNISQNSLQLLEKSGTSVHEEEISKDQVLNPIDLSNEENTLERYSDSPKMLISTINPYKLLKATTNGIEINPLEKKDENNYNAVHEVKKLSQCSMCDKIYDAPSSLKRHIESVHE